MNFDTRPAPAAPLGSPATTSAARPASLGTGGTLSLKKSGAPRESLEERRKKAAEKKKMAAAAAALTMKPAVSKLPMDDSMWDDF